MSLQNTLPWGLTTAVPYPRTEHAAHASVLLDPDTQQGIYVGPGGEPIKAGQHGTNKETSKSLTTGGGDGKNPTPSDDTASTDYGQD